MTLDQACKRARRCLKDFKAVVITRYDDAENDLRIRILKRDGRCSYTDVRVFPFVTNMRRSCFQRKDLSATLRAMRRYDRHKTFRYDVSVVHRGVL